MNILLIAPPIMDYVGDKLYPIAMDAVRECPPYGLYLLATILRQEGHEVVLADLIAEGSASMAKYQKEVHNANLIGISATSMSWPTALDLILQIRSHRSEVPIVLGGIHPTMFDVYLLTCFPVEFVIRGEAEQALPILCRAIEKKKPLRTVPNLTWKKRNHDIIRNPLAPKLTAEEISNFPTPDFSTMPAGVYKALSLESSRGCGFDCSFCSTSYRLGWRGIPSDLFVRRLEQIRPYIARTEMNTVHLVDDEFSLNPKRAIRIAELLNKRNLEISFVFDSRAKDILYPGYVASMAPFTSQFLVGAECGYDEGLKRTGKGTTTAILEHAAKLLYEENISQCADFSFILGFPWETAAEVKKTCRFALNLVQKYGIRVLLQWYCQIPGSRLWQEDRKNELVSEQQYDDYGFFRNLYLFRSGVKLRPSEIWEISHMITASQQLIRLKYPTIDMIEYALPEPVHRYYHELIYQNGDMGISSLREVARPEPASQKRIFSLRHAPSKGTIPVGHPSRHYIT